MMSKQEKIHSFNPNGVGIKGNLFGLPFSPDDAELIVVPVPWEVTVSYHAGTARGPQAILDASSQLDLFVRDIPDAWKLGVTLQPISTELVEEGSKLRDLATPYIKKLETGTTEHANDPVVTKINEGCENLNIYVKSTTQNLLKQGKLVGLLGGDHSTPLGFIRALSERYDRFGILHLDAHADLRKSYEGFTYSHASIMYNALKLPAVSRLVQVGIRDLCEEEFQVMQRAMGRVVTFFDDDIKSTKHAGEQWDSICTRIVKQLPDLVYISFDIDALDPKLCPNTGTPVPGGFNFDEMTYLIKKLVKSNKKIIGFDLVEVAPGASDWDANVGARMLYDLCNWMAVSHNKLRTKPD